MLSSVVAAYYYLRIVKMMYFDAPAGAFDRANPAVRVVLARREPRDAAVLGVPGPVVEAAAAAARSLF